MIKTIGTALFSFGLVGFCGTAHTAEPYAGVDVGFLDIGNASVTSLHLRGGAKLLENFAVEGRFGFGIGDDRVDTGFGEDYMADVSLKNLYGLYLKAGLPVAEQFFPYAVLGYTKAKGESEYEDATDSGSASGLSYGAGVDYSINNRFTINAEYMNYVDEDTGELSGFSIGASMAL